MIKSPEIYVVWKDGQFRMGGHGTDTLPQDEWKGVIDNLIFQAVSRCLDLDPGIIRCDFDVNVLYDGKMKKIDGEFRQALMSEYYTRQRMERAKNG